MNSGAFSDGCKQGLHGLTCPECRRPGRVKDRRAVMQVKPDGHGGAVRILEPRVRLQCFTPGCRNRNRSWTVYEDGYPRRKYTLALGVAVVKALGEVPGATLSSVARSFRVNRRTVGRLVGWTAGIATIESVAGQCAQIDPTLPVPAAPLPPEPPLPILPATLEKLAQAGHLILLLEHLAALLRGRGVALEQGPGLVALLRNQLNRWGEVFYVTGRAPPALRIPWPPGIPAS